MFSKWTLNSIHAAVALNLGQPVSDLLVATIMADEAVGEEGEERIVLVALHDGGSGDLTWDELVVGELGDVLAVFGNLVAGQSGAKPLNDVPMVLPLHIDGIDLVLEEVPVLLFWQLDVLPALAEIDFHVELAELVQELFCSGPLFGGDCTDVLVLLDVGAETFLGTVVHLGDWVEAVEERLEKGILGLLNDSQDPGSLWLVVRFDQALADGEGIPLLFFVVLPIHLD